MMFGWGAGGILAICQLAVKVYIYINFAAFKDATNNYRHISEEVKPYIIDSKAIHTTLWKHLGYLQ